MKQYIWLGDTPLAVYDGAATLYYVHPDHLDRPVAMTNATAMTLAWQAKYEPFGKTVLVTATPVNNMRLPGQWFQIEDGLAYNWHRTYDPGIGRYSQADPLGFVDGPSLFTYAKSSPAMKADPKGLTKIGPTSPRVPLTGPMCKPNNRPLTQIPALSAGGSDPDREQGCFEKCQHPRFPFELIGEGVASETSTTTN